MKKGLSMIIILLIMLVISFVGVKLFLNYKDSSISTVASINENVENKEVEPEVIIIENTSIEEDKNKNDFLENITLYSEQERIAKIKLEEEMAKKKEEQKKLDEENNKNIASSNNIKALLTYAVITIVGIALVTILIKSISKNKRKKDL